VNATGHCAEKLDVRRRDLHVDHEVGKRQREEDVDLLFFQQEGIEYQPVISLVKHGNDERQRLVPVDDPAEHVCGLAAVERGGEHLNLVIRLAVSPLRQRSLLERLEDVVHVSFEIHERPGPPEVLERFHEAFTKVVGAGVVAAIDRLGGLDRLVEIAARTKMRWLSAYVRFKIRVITELKNVSASSGCLWPTSSPM
jgi:hypothetical protein